MSLLAVVQEPHTELNDALRLTIAALVGLAVGVEREWSGHAAGPQGRFAGLRTFLLLGLLGGTAGMLTASGNAMAGASLLIGGGLFVVAAYVMAVRRPGIALDGTTEAAALVVLALGLLAGLDQLLLAGGTAALMVFILGEKERLHAIVRHIGEREMHAALQFAVLALVVLPLLPEGPYGPFGGIRPRDLWMLVLLFSGIQFAGYITKRVIGAQKGYGVAGLLGGLVSSTAVTLQFSRQSRREPENGVALALGTIAACTVLPLRLAAITVVLNAPVAISLIPYLLPPTLVGCGVLAFALRRTMGAPVSQTDAGASSPLRLWSAIQMAVLFQFSMMVMALMRSYWGAAGVTASAVGLGLTDMDALTVSMTHLADGSDTVTLAAWGIGVGMLTNTAFKLVMGLVLGSGAFRRVVAGGLVALGVASVAGLWWGARR